MWGDHNGRVVIGQRVAIVVEGRYPEAKGQYRSRPLFDVPRVEHAARRLTSGEIPRALRVYGRLGQRCHSEPCPERHEGR